LLLSLELKEGNSLVLLGVTVKGETDISGGDAVVGEESLDVFLDEGLGQSTEEDGLATRGERLEHINVDVTSINFSTVLLAGLGGSLNVVEGHNCSSAEGLGFIIDPLNVGDLTNVSKSSLMLSSLVSYDILEM